MPTTIRIALIDLYDGIPNQGIRAITESVDQLSADRPDVKIVFDRFETRVNAQTPGLNYDIYISSGGPGSPFDGEGYEWEKNYFDLVERIYTQNMTETDESAKKHVLFICHSFQLMCRHFELALVKKRHSTSFGILKVHQTEAGRVDPLFNNLPDPFYAGDFRAYQAIEANHDRLKDLGASIIALEKERPHVPYERAIMGIRISDEMVGVQFHPEADPPGMRLHFEKPKRKKEIVTKYSLERYERLMDRLDDPNFLEATHQTVVPNFFEGALRKLIQTNHHVVQAS